MTHWEFKSLWVQELWHCWTVVLLVWLMCVELKHVCFLQQDDGLIWSLKLESVILFHKTWSNHVTFYNAKLSILHVVYLICKIQPILQPAFVFKVFSWDSWSGLIVSMFRKRVKAKAKSSMRESVNERGQWLLQLLMLSRIMMTWTNN